MKVFALEDVDYSLVAADLSRARRFLDALAALPPGYEVSVIREALTLAAVVSYCRPFLSSYDAEKKRHVWIPEDLAEDLPARWRRCHDRIVSARHKAWAHTDWSSHEARPSYESNGACSVLSRNPWAPLESEQVEEFHALLGQVEARLQPASLASMAEQAFAADVGHDPVSPKRGGAVGRRG